MGQLWGVMPLGMVKLSAQAFAFLADGHPSWSSIRWITLPLGFADFGSALLF